MPVVQGVTSKNLSGYIDSVGEKVFPSSFHPSWHRRCRLPERQGEVETARERCGTYILHTSIKQKSPRTRGAGNGKYHQHIPFHPERQAQ